MKFIPAKEEHTPAEEVAQVRARIIECTVKSNIWLIFNKQFIFHKNNKETKKDSQQHWTCLGRYHFGCRAKVLTQRALEDGRPVKLVHLWRSQLHTCNVDYSHIFTRDLKNRIKQSQISIILYTCTCKSEYS